jgi:hypothetical protein
VQIVAEEEKSGRTYLALEIPRSQQPEISQIERIDLGVMEMAFG